MNRKTLAQQVNDYMRRGEIGKSVLGFYGGMLNGVQFVAISQVFIVDVA